MLILDYRYVTQLLPIEIFDHFVVLTKSDLPIFKKLANLYKTNMVLLILKFL